MRYTAIKMLLIAPLGIGCGFFRPQSDNVQYRLGYQVTSQRFRAIRETKMEEGIAQFVDKIQGLRDKKELNHQYCTAIFLGPKAEVGSPESIITKIIDSPEVFFPMFTKRLRSEPETVWALRPYNFSLGEIDDLMTVKITDRNTNSVTLESFGWHPFKGTATHAVVEDHDQNVWYVVVGHGPSGQREGAFRQWFNSVFPWDFFVKIRTYPQLKESHAKTQDS